MSLSRHGLVLTVAALLFFRGVGGAHSYPEAYPPFPFSKPSAYPTLVAVPVIDYQHPAEFRDGHLRVAVTSVSEGQVTTRVFVNGRTILDTVEAHPGIPLPVGARVFYTDLTGDGQRDLLIYSSPAGNGLAAWIEIADLLIAKGDGTFKHVTFEAFAAGPEDFIDTNGDGCYEMLWVYYFFSGGHSYWVYRIVELGEQRIRLRDELAPGFPKIIWFSEKPNDQLAGQLALSERDDLIWQSSTKWNATYQAR